MPVVNGTSHCLISKSLNMRPTMPVAEAEPNTHPSGSNRKINYVCREDSSFIPARVIIESSYQRHFPECGSQYHINVLLHTEESHFSARETWTGARERTFNILLLHGQ